MTALAKSQSSAEASAITDITEEPHSPAPVQTLSKGFGKMFALVAQPKFRRCQQLEGSQEEELLSNAHEGGKSLCVSGLPKEKSTFFLTVAEEG
jgi:hypothetical protein